MTRYQKRFQKLASEIAKREGLKKEISIGNVREVLSILMDPFFFYCFLDLAFHQPYPKKKKRGKK